MPLLDSKWRHDEMPPAGALSQTFDFLDGLARSGLTVAPYQPSPGMVQAGAQAGNITESQAKAIYLAMVSHNE
mgnify:CR=1 FL=1